jgi:hypothetical protein
MTLGEKQELFAYLYAKWVLWVYEVKGWRLRESEGYVGDTDAADGDYDGPHKKGGGHYLKIARDVNLFVGGKWLSKGNEPEWAEAGKHWESLDPLCRWGGKFASPDANHLGLFHEGRA